MIFLYHILTFCIFVLALPFLPFVLVFSQKRRANLLQRLGVFSRPLPKMSGVKRIWIHALSVGEVRSAMPLVQALVSQARKKDKNGKTPCMEIVFSASTVTGHAMARQLFSDQSFFPMQEPVQEIVQNIFYFPFDLWFSLHRVTGHIAPDAVCMVETDFWPGFLHVMHRKNIPVILVNARLSLSSLKGYLAIGPLKKLFFPLFSRICAQTDQDRKRFKRLGVDSSRISITGNMKFDMVLPSMSDMEKNKLRTKLGIRENSLVWIAGSTHEGEEAAILGVFARLEPPEKKKQPLCLIIAPRNPERCKELLPLMKKYGFSPVLYSRSYNSSGNDKPGLQGRLPEQDRHVILIDVMGVLAQIYAVCDLAFVGGSLVSEGGHNPLEPAMYEKAVLFGPDMSDFQEIARIMEKRSAAQTVNNNEEMYKAVHSILSHPDLALSMGKAAGTLCRENTGAVDRTVAIIQEYLRF